jgi:hypothetical protein
MVTPKATAPINSTAISARIRVEIFMGPPKPAGEDRDSREDKMQDRDQR